MLGAWHLMQFRDARGGGVAEEWVEKSLHPLLRLDGEEIEIEYEPLSVDGDGDSPAFVQFRVECVIPHSLRGRLVYTADDLYFACRVFNDFTSGLKAILEGHHVETSLGSTSSELVFTVVRDSKIRVNISINEWEPANEKNTVATAGRIVRNTDVLYRWVNELRSFSEYLDNWILMKRPYS